VNKFSKLFIYKKELIGYVKFFNGKYGIILRILSGFGRLLYRENFHWVNAVGNRCYLALMDGEVSLVKKEHQ